MHNLPPFPLTVGDVLKEISDQLKVITGMLEKMHRDMPKQWETHDVCVTNTPIEVTGGVTAYKSDY